MNNVFCIRFLLTSLNFLLRDNDARETQQDRADITCETVGRRTVN